MKIAVYTIAKDESQFVQAWFDSAKQADYLLIADTGSTDNTVKLAQSLGINVINIGISPWRFDDARNAALAALPLDVDYCIALDMDEQLQPGWREHLESLDPSVITRPRYQYTWNWNDDGSPGLQYGGDKIHTRKGYRWKHPVHEVLTMNGAEHQQWCALEIHHHPDDSKSRSQYLPLLALSVMEDPHDDRNAFYYARELFFKGANEFAAAEFKRHLDLPKAVWKPERAASMRYLAQCEPFLATYWLNLAADETPDRREPWVDLANHYYKIADWPRVMKYAKRAIEIAEKPLDYICEAAAWGPLPYDLAALAAYNMGLAELAVQYGNQALELAPADGRLAQNLDFYRHAA